MARLKTAPKVVMIVAVVAALGYGINTYLDSHKTAPSAEVAVSQPTVQAPVEQAQVAPSAVVVETKTVQPQASAPQAEDTSSNAGLSKLLQSGMKR